MIVRDVPVADVVVNGRHRSDLGDVAALAASMEDVGLLQPIVVTEDLRLVAGQRRLEAAKRLGWTLSPANVAADLAEARRLLAAELAENVCRKDMTPGEQVSLGRELEALERPRAEQSKRDGAAKARAKKVGIVDEAKFPPSTRGERTGKVYDLVGEAVGMSGPTYKRAKAVAHMAEHGETLPKGTAKHGTPLTAAQHAVAREALAEMEATGKVTPAYNKAMAARKAGTGPNGIVPKTRTSKGRKAPQAIRNAISVLVGLTGSLGEFTAADAAPTAEEAAQWEGDLSAAVRAINTFRKQLKKEYSHG